jgi:hypothetical protein
MSELEDAMVKHMTYLVYTENRPFSYRDFMHFEVDGNQHKMTHGTFRNKVSDFIKKEIAELDYKSSIAFYTLKGVSFGNKKKTTNHMVMTPWMTPNHMVVSPVTNVINNNNEITRLPIYKAIQRFPPDRKALHNIRLRFQVQDSWTILKSSSKYKPNTVSKDIQLPVLNTDNLNIRIIIHRTNTISVIVGCSNAPVVINIEDIIRLCTALTRAEERLSRIIDDCGNSLPGGYESIPIPNYKMWSVRMWHFGTDSKITNEFAQEKFCETWQIAEKVLARVYNNKNLRHNGDGNGRTKRQEIQECPNKSFADAIKDKVSRSGQVLIEQKNIWKPDKTNLEGKA